MRTDAGDVIDLGTRFGIEADAGVSAGWRYFLERWTVSTPVLEGASDGVSD